MFLQNGKVPLRWWNQEPNFGDILSSWLVSKITGHEVVEVQGTQPHYIAIGSVVGMAKPLSVLWGTGSFGFDPKEPICTTSTYLAVRGPLTRSKLAMSGIRCPRIYGDPALLTPEFYRPDIKPVHEVGVVLRWSEDKWNNALNGDGIKKIFLKTGEIEKTLDEMLSCKRIITSSLHGLIIADAYGIPNAWLASDTPNGREFKFWDYFASIDKNRPPQVYDMAAPRLTAKKLIEDFKFDERQMKFDADALKGACPFGWGPVTV